MHSQFFLISLNPHQYLRIFVFHKKHPLSLGAHLYALDKNNHHNFFSILHSYGWMLFLHFYAAFAKA